jgi:hypothetical protein
MWRLSRTERLLAAGIFLSVAGCNATAPVDGEDIIFADRWYVTVAKYNNHMTAAELESLHRIEINDVAALRAHLESSLAQDVQMLWASIQDEHTTAKDREAAYGLLRLIAIQDEHFPVRAIDDDAKVTAILQAAIANDPAHAALLRRQDWSKPKWVNWVP